jgi:hypothetical protein
MENESDYLNYEINQLSNTSALFLNILDFRTHQLPPSVGTDKKNHKFLKLVLAHNQDTHESGHRTNPPVTTNISTQLDFQQLTNQVQLLTQTMLATQG